jgi:transcriptional regulator with XRE-family HTH domain
MAGPGTKIKRLRTGLGLTQRDLAQQLGVSQQTVARWEGGATVPTKYLRDVAILLSCTLADLLGYGEPSYVARWAERRKGERLDNSDVPYGTLRIAFAPPAGVSPVAIEERSREYPITEGERRRLSIRLERRDGVEEWLSFETLNNKFVCVNRRAIEMIETVGDDVEAMPPFEHEEVYKALLDPDVQEVLEGRKPVETFDAEDAPYSRALVDRCVELAADTGGVEPLLEAVGSISIESVDGRRMSLFSDPEGDALEEVTLLGLQIDDFGLTPEHSQLNDWLVELSTEGYYRSTRFRLGCLRLIETPLERLREANRRTLAEEGDRDESRASGSARGAARAS